MIDSTWYDYSRPLVADLPGRLVELRCQVSPEVVRRRYRARVRDPRHLDVLRSEEELWGEPVAALGVGPLVEVETSALVDVAGLAERVRRLAGH